MYRRLVGYLHNTKRIVNLLKSNANGVSKCLQREITKIIIISVINVSTTVNGANSNSKRKSIRNTNINVLRRESIVCCANRV